MFDFFALYKEFGGVEDDEAFDKVVDFVEKETGVKYWDFDGFNGWQEFEEWFMFEPDDFTPDEDDDED